MKTLLIVTMALTLLAPIANGLTTTDSFNWTVYDDFASSESYSNWYKRGTSYNMSTYYSMNGQMVLRSHANYMWGASTHSYAFVPDENVRGIKADIWLKDTSYPAYGTGRNVIGVRVSENCEIYMGFFSNSYTHNIQVGYRLDGEDVIPTGWSSQQLTFEQKYEAAIVLDDSGNNLLFFLNNQLFEMINIYPGSNGIEQFFIETDIEKNLNTDFSIDNYCVLVPEPGTLLLLGLGGLLFRKYNS